MPKEINYYKLLELYKKGYTVPEMSKKLKEPKKQIQSELIRTGITPDEKSVKTNKRTHCAKCQYSGSSSMGLCCNYLLITGKIRGCNSRYCIRYVKGQRIRIGEDG